MIKKKTKGLLLVISGPSGVGKGTICRKLVDENPELFLSISMTTRAPRGAEVEGNEYYFVTEEEFEKRIESNKMLEYNKYVNGCYYGTPKDKVDEMLSKGKDVILEIDINGALQVKEQITEGIFIFLLPPNMRELKNRLEGRKTESKEKILERFKRAYQEINEYPKYNYIVINDELDETVKKIEAIIISEKCRVDRIDDVDLYNQEEVLHELLMDQK